MNSVRYQALLWLMLAIGSLTLLGCASKGRQVNNPDNEQWFCQSNETGEGWECVQDDLLAQVPVPTRMPPEPDTGQQAIDDAIDPLNLDDPLPGRRQGPPAPGVPQPISQNSPAAGISTDTVTDAAQASADQATTASTALPVEPPENAASANEGYFPTGVPKYVQLAYVPPEPTTIMALPADFFAVQILAMDSPQQLEDYVNSNGMRGMSAARVESNGQLKYVLLLGIYTTQAAAKEAITELPPPLDAAEPWVRPLGELQQSIRRADELAAQDPAAAQS